MARFCKCPNCGALHAIERTASDRDEVRLAPCLACRVNGELSRLAWGSAEKKPLQKRLTKEGAMMI